MPSFYQPDPYSEEEQRIQQNLLYAQELRKQGLQPVQGQMVSGNYVAPSPMEGIAGMLKSYLGARGETDALDQERALSQRAMSDRSAAMSSILSTQDPQERLKIALTSQDPSARALGGTLMADMLKRKDMAEAAALKGPRSREVMMGDQKVTQEYNSQTGQWSEVGRGNAFKPDKSDVLSPEAFAQHEALANMRGRAGAQPYFTGINTSQFGQVPLDARTGRISIPGIGPVDYKDLPNVMAQHPELAGTGLTRPTDDPSLQGEIAGAKETEKKQADIEVARPQAVTATNAAAASLDKVQATVGELLKNQNGLERSTGITGRFPTVPGSDSANWQADLATLKSQLGLRGIQELRDASKTGGAVGNATEKEWDMLANAYVALSQSQSAPEFKENLSTLNTMLDGARTRIKEAFGRQYTAPAGQPAAPYTGTDRRTPRDFTGYSIEPVQ